MLQDGAVGHQFRGDLADPVVLDGQQVPVPDHLMDLADRHVEFLGEVRQVDPGGRPGGYGIAHTYSVPDRRTNA
ncbi:hypothetical protein GCM10010436_37270 [Paractinoplanes durhamensis]